MSPNRTLFHVCTFNRVRRYRERGSIKAPVRAWVTMEAALDFSSRTGRRVILRLKDDGSFVELEGHKSCAVISYKDYNTKNF